MDNETIALPLELAEPVSAVGGDVEVRTIAYAAKDRDTWPELSFTWLKRFDTLQKHNTYQVFELVDRAHVTRLQAEVEQLKREIATLQNNAERGKKKYQKLLKRNQALASSRKGYERKLRESLAEFDDLQALYRAAVEGRNE